MGSSCSVSKKIHVSEPTVISQELRDYDKLDSPQKEYPIIAPNAKGLRQLVQYNKYPEEVKSVIAMATYPE